MTPYEYLERRYNETVANPLRSEEKKNEILAALRRDILTIEWETTIPRDVQFLLSKVNERLC